MSRKLPILLKQCDYSFFQTNADVLVSDFMSAVSYLAGDNLVFFLAVPQVDVFLLRLVKYYFVRNWYQGFILLTQTDQTDLVRNELAGVLDKVAYGCSAQLSDGAMAILGNQQTVYLQGPMLLATEKRLCTYSAYYGHDRAVIRSFMEAYLPKVRTSKKMIPTDESVLEILNM